jgi:hypothetical protein
MNNRREPGADCPGPGSPPGCRHSDAGPAPMPRAPVPAALSWSTFATIDALRRGSPSASEATPLKLTMILAVPGWTPVTSLTPSTVAKAGLLEPQFGSGSPIAVPPASVTVASNGNAAGAHILRCARARRARLPSAPPDLLPTPMVPLCDRCRMVPASRGDPHHRHAPVLGCGLQVSPLSCGIQSVGLLLKVRDALRPAIQP